MLEPSISRHKGCVHRRLDSSSCRPRDSALHKLTYSLTYVGHDVTSDGNASRHIPKRDALAEAVRRAQLRRMNELLRAVAQREGVEFVDVFAVDESLGFHHGLGMDRFHVPEQASMAAAFALLWQLLGRTDPPPRSLALAKAAAKRLRLDA